MKTKKMFDGNKLLIRYRGPYDFDGLLEIIRNHYPAVKIDDMAETKFKHKMGGTGAEVEFKMEGTRKLTHLLKVVLNVEGRLVDVKPKEQMFNGKKQMITNGKLEIRISSELIIDYAGKFPEEGKGWQQKIEKQMADELQRTGGIIYGDVKLTGENFAKKIVKDLHKAIKKHLNMVCV